MRITRAQLTFLKTLKTLNRSCIMHKPPVPTTRRVASWFEPPSALTSPPTPSPRRPKTATLFSSQVALGYIHGFQDPQSELHCQRSTAILPTTLLPGRNICLIQQSACTLAPAPHVTYLRSLYNPPRIHLHKPLHLEMASILVLQLVAQVGTT